jgi:hypothetical protein
MNELQSVPSVASDGTDGARRRGRRPALYVRATVAVALLVVWGMAAFSGVLLWLAPVGPRSGQLPLLLGLTKSLWGDLHFWVSVLALAVTGVHLAVDWRALRGCVRFLTSVDRGPVVCE